MKIIRLVKNKYIKLLKIEKGDKNDKKIFIDTYVY